MHTGLSSDSFVGGVILGFWIVIGIPYVYLRSWRMERVSRKMQTRFCEGDTIQPPPKVVSADYSENRSMNVTLDDMIPGSMAYDAYSTLKETMRANPKDINVDQFTPLQADDSRAPPAAPAFLQNRTDPLAFALSAIPTEMGDGGTTKKTAARMPKGTNRPSFED